MNIKEKVKYANYVLFAAVIVRLLYGLYSSQKNTYFGTVVFAFVITAGIFGYCILTKRTWVYYFFAVVGGFGVIIGFIDITSYGIYSTTQVFAFVIALLELLLSMYLIKHIKILKNK